MHGTLRLLTDLRNNAFLGLTEVLDHMHESEGCPGQSSLLVLRSVFVITNPGELAEQNSPRANKVDTGDGKRDFKARYVVETSIIRNVDKTE